MSLKIGRDDVVVFLAFDAEIILSTQMSDKYTADMIDMVAQVHNHNLEFGVVWKIEDRGRITALTFKVSTTTPKETRSSSLKASKVSFSPRESGI